MQNVSNLYNSIVAGEHWFEWKLDIGGISIPENELFSLATYHAMFSGSPKVGQAVAGEIEAVVLNPAQEIPRMTEVRPYTRACNVSNKSEWVAQGVFFIDMRERSKNDDGLDVLTIHGFDAMLKAEQPYNGQITGDSTDLQMVNEIAYQMGVAVDARTTALMDKAYTIPFPIGYTLREILGYIAAMYVGCFIISDEGKLRLVSILELPPETNYLIDERGDAITFGGDRILV